MKSKRYKAGKQTELNLWRGSWGGRRPNAGRKEKHSKGVAHRTRERMDHRTPVHVNFKLRARIRNKACLGLLKRAILNARKQGLRVVHYSLQSNHIHLILEAAENKTLTRGMRSLTITFAKGLSAGRVQPERYHLHVLRGPTEARNAVRYVLLNEQRHRGKPVAWDDFASWGALGREALQGLIGRVPRALEFPRFLDHPFSWVLRRGTSAA